MALSFACSFNTPSLKMLEHTSTLDLIFQVWGFGRSIKTGHNRWRFFSYDVFPPVFVSQWFSWEKAPSDYSTTLKGESKPVWGSTATEQESNSFHTVPTVPTVPTQSVMIGILVKPVFDGWFFTTVRKNTETPSWAFLARNRNKIMK